MAKIIIECNRTLIKTVFGVGEGFIQTVLEFYNINFNLDGDSFHNLLSFI